MPLFDNTPMTAVSLPTVPECWACGLYKGDIHHPKMKPTGKGHKGILIVGEAPGEDEDKQGRQFVGRTGRELRNVLAVNAIDPDKDCWFTNALICRPPNNKIPKLTMIGNCRPNLMNTIEELQPKVILLLGAKSVRSLIGHLMVDEKRTGIRQWAGWQIPCRRPNAWICPTFHPSYILREEKRNYYPVLRRMWEQHIRTAVRLKERPWKKVPDYAGQVVCEKSHRGAALLVKMLCFEGNTLAFDFETNMLKPDSKRSRIVSCSVSDGHTTVAYPWHGKAIEYTLKMLRAKNIRKVGYNLKFEDRWVRAKYGFGVRNWLHDGMNVAHGLDNRGGISSLRFQAFALLGQEDYDSHIKPYLKSKEDGGYEENRIDQLPLDDLLLYNGLDSLMEYKVWEKQMETLSCRKSG